MKSLRENQRRLITAHGKRSSSNCLGILHRCSKVSSWGRKVSFEKTTAETSYCWAQNVTVWNHDIAPSVDDALLRTFHWFAVACKSGKSFSTGLLVSVQFLKNVNVQFLKNVNGITILLSPHL